MADKGSWNMSARIVPQVCHGVSLELNSKSSDFTVTPKTSY